MTNKARSESVPRAVQLCHECILWMIPQLDKLPRSRRFTVGERIEGGLLDVLELLIESTYTSDNRKALQQANHQLAVIRHLWRLTYELKNIGIKRYEYGTEMMVQLGSQIGGWMKSRTARS